MDELALSTLFVCLILVIYILTSHVIELKQIPYIHESAVSILLGAFAAFILQIVWDIKITFKQETFFYIILPPIIFSAGYNLRKKYFFDNFGLILFYGVVGTLLAFIVIASFSILLNELDIFFPQKLSIHDLLLLSAVLCATDTVAVLNLVKESHFPQLHSILFGEGIMNDAISIVIFRSVKNYFTDEYSQLTGTMVIMLSLEFIYLCSMSVLIGACFGLGVSLFFKKFESYNEYPLRETAFILLSAYIAYSVSELLHLSGILSLFVCGVVMGHYAYHNLSEASQKGTVLAFESVAYLSEAFVYAYLGVSVTGVTLSEVPFAFAFMMLLILLFARFFSVFSLPCCSYLCRRSNFPLKIKELKIVWYSGLIRGAIAFALSLQIDSPNSKKVVNVVLVVVLFTIVILSSLLESFSRHIGLKRSEEEALIQNYKIDPEKIEELSRYNQIGTYREDAQQRSKASETTITSEKSSTFSVSNGAANGATSSAEQNSIATNNAQLYSQNNQITQRLSSFELNYIRPLFVRDEVAPTLELHDLRTAQQAVLEAPVSPVRSGIN